MNSGKYVFAQLVEFLPQRVFDTIVSRYKGNKYVRHFSCWNQMLCMIFGQLTGRDSLRDLIVVLDAHRKKSYHLGLGKSVTRSNLSKANERRNYGIFEDFAYHLIAIARRNRLKKDFEIKGKIYAFDSSTIVERSTYEILQIIGTSLLDKTAINELFTNAVYKNDKNVFSNQLEFKWI